MEIRFLGLIPYEEARAMQEQLVRELAEDKSKECVLILEHPSVITVGPRTKSSDIPAAISLNGNGGHNRLDGIPVVKVDRGGGATYHGPGQLIVYPIISLKARQLGVRAFVSRGLQVLSRVAIQCGVVVEPSLSPAGLWVGSRGVGNMAEAPRKIGAVGLRISQGITNHGFSFNVSPDLTVFNGFVSCSLAGVQPTSLVAEGGYPRDIDSVKKRLAAEFKDEFCR